ncbi:hypothetical protein RB653_002429 [Dictyostelium firmibasis]|uniref:U2A'/phosphoprotein 32 family A C-terminal domain-containing protein n=1 Tax=Dictyostelium firmibasis TaxID=79012 RepID=A0AAN7U8Z0_9MYCE
MSSATKLTPDNISFKIGKKIDINSIEELELSSLGFIDATSSFSRLKCLKKLDLSSNRFQLIRNIKGLFDLPVIEDLNLTGNPVSKQTNYRLIVIQNLPTLLILDEKKITVTERNQAREFDVNQVVKDPLKKNIDIDEEKDDEEKDDEEKVVEKKQEDNKQTVNKIKHDESVEEVSKKLDEDLLFGTKSNQKKKLIFEDDEEISLDSVDLSKLEKKPIEKPTKKSILFTEDDGEDNLFDFKADKTKSKKPLNLQLDDDLFGDDNGNDSKLSSDFDISSYINSQKSRAKSSLFDD